MGAEQQVARNFAALGGGEALSRLIAFAGTVYLARVLGAESYGVIALAAGVTLYLAKIADFAIETVGTYEVAHGRNALPQLIAAVMAARLALTTILVVVAVATVQLLLRDPERTVLTLYFLTLVPIAASTKWVHMGRESARPIAVTRILGEMCALGVLLTAVHGPQELWVVPISQLLGETIVVGALYALLLRAGLVWRLRWDPSTAYPVFRRAAPLVAQIILGLVLYNCELIFLRVMAGSADVGFYAAAYTLISFLTNIAIAYGTSLLPTLTRLGSGTREERALYHTALAHTFALSFPVSIGGSFLAPAIIAAAFGTGYAPGGPVLGVLIWVVPITAVRTVAWAALVARAQHGLLLRATVYAVGVNLLLNLVLIHFYGMMGAAFSTVLTESFIALWMLYYAVGEGLNPVSLTRLRPPLAAGAGMGLALSLVAGPHFLLRGALAMATYGALLMLLGAIRIRAPRIHTPPRFVIRVLQQFA